MKSFRFTQLLSILIVILLALSVAGCKQNQPVGSSKSETTQSQTTKATTSKAEEKIDPLGKYDPIVEVTASRMVPEGFKFVDGETLDNNKWVKALYEDTLGVKVKYLWTAPQAQFEQKMAVSIASDDLPDFMRVNVKQFRLLAESDKLLDISEIYDKYASDTMRKCYEGDDGLSLSLGEIDGKLMALPAPASPLDTSFLIWLRYDWLQKLNLAEPKNMDDLISIMDAFANQDPDGNNINDTYGMGLEKNFGGFAGLEGFFNGYQAYPNSWVKDIEGKLASGAIQPEVKTALLKLQELYNRGIIDKEFGVKDAAKVAEDTTSGKVGLVFGQMWNPLWPLQESVNKDPNADWRPYPVVSATNKAAMPSINMGVNDMQFLAVNKKAKHPEIAIKLVNAQAEQWLGLFYGNEFHKETVPMDIQDEYLEKGITQAWQYQFFEIGPANKNLTQHLKSIAIVDGKEPENGALKNIVEAIIGFEKNGDRSFWGRALVFGHSGSFNVINNHYNIPKNFKLDEFYGPPTKTLIEKGSTLGKMQAEVFTKIIMGDPIDNFDKFVSDWKKLGGDDITKEVNEWYKNK
jgi:putative aldouronate transport system substrate-binding protein